MYFVIENGSINKAEETKWNESQDAISVFSTKEWEEQSNFRTEYNLDQPHHNHHFCKMESHAHYLFGTLSIPIKKDPSKHNGFALYILEGKIIFIDDTEMALTTIKKISEGIGKREYTLERFLYDFLVSFIEDDLQYLELFEREISKAEESVLNGDFDDFNFHMLSIKKEIARLYRYYSQLTDVGEELSQNEMDFFGKNDIATFKVFTERASRLQGEAQVIRDYAMQVQDVYQSEISIRQNDVMKVLTIVTMIFLPLTLIAGWYGMNFMYMPELGWKYGYPAVGFLSVMVVVVSLWIFKKKKFW